MTKRLVQGYLVALLGLLAGSCQAHEFWLAPLAYRIGPLQPLQVDIRVGQHFKGEPFPYLPRNTLRFDITQGRFSRAVKSRIGDLPAVDEPVGGNGLLILSHVSTDAETTFDDLSEFAEYLQKVGLDWVLAAHRRRGLASGGFTEAYQRFAKTLVAVGEGRGRDRPLGLRLEWVLANNPYTEPGSGYRAQLLWQGAPLPAATAQLFIARAGEVREQSLTTDAEGWVEFRAARGDEVLLNAVQMIEPETDRHDWQPHVVWKSLWTSLTFLAG